MHKIRTQHNNEQLNLPPWSVCSLKSYLAAVKAQGTNVAVAVDRVNECRAENVRQTRAIANKGTIQSEGEARDMIRTWRWYERVNVGNINNEIEDKANQNLDAKNQLQQILIKKYRALLRHRTQNMTRCNCIIKLVAAVTVPPPQFDKTQVIAHVF